MHKNTQNALFVALLLFAGVVSFQGIYSAVRYSASAQTLVERFGNINRPSGLPSTQTSQQLDDHACPDKAQKGDYNCDDKTDYDDFTIFQRDFQREETPLAPYFEWVRQHVFDIIPTTVPTSAPESTETPTQPPSNTAAPTQTLTLVPTQAQSMTAMVQSAIDKVEESSIKANMEKIVDKDTQLGNDSKQTRFTGTSGNETEAAYIKSFFEQLGLEVEYQPFSFGSFSTKNVIARIYGSDRNTWYLAMAHMDSISENRQVSAPGADDNGSGTVAVMEMAKAIKQSGVPLKRSIEFVLYSGEELGLYGSEHYVKNIPTGKKIIAALNFDMVGNKGAKPDCVSMNFKSRSGGNLITDTIVDVNKDFNIGLDTVSQASTETRSDHYPFWKKNMVATFGHECEFSPVYHTTNDTPSTISYSQITKVAKAVAGALVKMSHEGQGQQLQIADSGVMAADTGVLAAETTRNEDAADENAPDEVQTAPILAYIQYSRPEDLNTLHGFATNFIAYIEESYVETPVFLGMFTQEGVQKAQQAGFTVNIIDENADLNNYEYLYHPRSGQSDALKSLGEPTEIASRYYLVKLAPGKDFDHSGPTAQFFDLPLPRNENLPAFVDQRITLAPTQPVAGPPSEVVKPVQGTLFSRYQLPLLLVIGLLVSGIIGFIVLHKRAQ